MKDAHKVVWTEGMFLRPHHFQQAENYLEGYMRNWGQAHSGCFWGFLTLDLDQTLLRQGKIRYFGSSAFPADRIVEAHWVSDRRGSDGGSWWRRLLVQFPQPGVFQERIVGVDGGDEEEHRLRAAVAARERTS